MSVIRAMVVDDQAMVRAGLKTLLELPGTPAISVEWSAENGRQALDLLEANLPDVVLMDIRMPVLDGIDALREIRAAPRTANLPVVMLTTFDEDALIFASLDAGASGVMRKDLDPGPLREAVHSAVRGDLAIDPRMTRRVVERTSQRAAASEADVQRVGALTERERDVLACVGKGLTNDEIASALFLSPATTRTYVSRLMARLECRDRVALVLLANRTLA